MPLDGHSYLVSQGWGGKGTGLREGAISRPLAIVQKKNLAGLGKDRDEAFPFWDHLFSAAANSIVIKCLSEDEDSGAEASSSNEVTLKRTSTGILSNRRPIEGTPATSGTATPDESAPRLSLIANAKRDAARRGLYSRFFKGPVLGPETIAAEEKRLAALVSEAFAKQNPATESVTVTEHIEIKTADTVVAVDLEVSKSHRKKKREQVEKGPDSETEDDGARRERKRRRKEKRKEAEREQRKEEAKKSNRKSRDGNEDAEAGPSKDASANTADSNDMKADGKETKEERKQRKEEKRRLKALRKAEELAATEVLAAQDANEIHLSKVSRDKKEKKERKSSHSVSKAESKESTVDTQSGEDKKKKKKKRKRADTDED